MAAMAARCYAMLCHSPCPSHSAMHLSTNHRSTPCLKLRTSIEKHQEAIETIFKNGLVEECQGKTQVEIGKSKMNGDHGTSLMDAHKQPTIHCHCWHFAAQSTSEYATESHGCEKTHTRH